jgi:squalene-hopene/tetraprenyl-beta-curcumene cyclase
MCEWPSGRRQVVLDDFVEPSISWGFFVRGLREDESMAIRQACVLLIAAGILAYMASAPARGGEDAPEHWNKTGASEYLDQRGAEWFKFDAARRGEGDSAISCVSCHTLLPYALARPVLRRLSDEKAPTEMETKVIEQVKNRVSNWDRLDKSPFALFYDFDDDKKKQSRGTEAILSALVLSLDDRAHARREPSEHAKKALATLWSTQITDGEHKGSWEWLNFGMEPWEGASGRYLGATMAAIAVGTAKENGYSIGDGDSRVRLEALRGYLKKNDAAQNLHNRVWTLWASAKMDGLLTREQKDGLIGQILAKQQPDGGFSLGSLGKFARKDVKDQSKTADGYASGLILHVLQVAGVAKDNPQVVKGLAWLRSNQDPSGAWRAASLNKNRAPESADKGKANIGKFMWDAATGYSVLALSH